MIPPPFLQYLGRAAPLGVNKGRPLLIKILNQLLRNKIPLKIKPKNRLLCCLGAGLFQTRTTLYQMSRPMNSVYNWSTFLLLPEFSRSRFRNGSPRQLVN